VHARASPLFLFDDLNYTWPIRRSEERDGMSAGGRECGLWGEKEVRRSETWKGIRLGDCDDDDGVRRFANFVVQLCKSCIESLNAEWLEFRIVRI